MTVALDASYSVGPALSGVGVYCARIIEALAKAAPESHFILCYRANRLLYSLLRPLPARNLSRRVLEESLPGLSPRGIGLFHGLNQRLPHLKFERAVTTFHDLFVMTGEYSTGEFRRRFTSLARHAASRSDRILAVSRHTAGQIQSLLGVEPSRIAVVYHGVDRIPQFAAEDLTAFRRRHHVERPFLLHVGAIQTRKNITRLVEAFERLGQDMDLVLAGSDGYGAREIHARISASPAARRIHVLGYVKRSAIERLYRSAAVLAFPSLDEGFGLPVLEAMSAGLPVVTSNRSAVAEVARDAALLVDPADPDAIAAALTRAITDSAMREELIRNGVQRAAQFGWERAALETLASYREVLGN